jgi:alkaline phosphatase D
MKILLFFACSIVTIISSAQTTKIAFGSCSQQEDSLEIFDEILKHKPNYFIFLGDNVYHDTKNRDSLKLRYDNLSKRTSFQRLKKNTTIYATWDDHDYGWNDIGKYYELKNESKEIFLDFFEEPANSERRKHEGIYTSYFQKVKGKTIQFILLDERTFRSNLQVYTHEYNYLYDNWRFFYNIEYVPCLSSDSTILGNEQWTWLENEFKKPADLRIICSGTQFGIEFNGYESWANFPKEQEKMLNLIKSTKANGVIFLSGDVHYSEISKLQSDSLYPIYDITSSGLSETWKFATPNVNRIEGPIMDNNFGLLSINWKKKQILMEIWDKFGNQRVEYSIPINQLKF